jgi:DNA-binding CsgD family transcriptional regulator
VTTPREQEALDLLLQGVTPPEIAARLHVSYWTVHGYLRRLRLKHHAGTTLELAVKLLTAQRDDARRERDECRRSLAVLDRRRSC